MRGQVLSLKQKEFIEAARSIGAKSPRIMFRHLMPNAVFPVLVMASMDIGSYVLTFAALFVDMAIQGLGRINADFFMNFPSRRADSAGILSAWVGSLLVMLVTALAPVIGYDLAAAIAKRALAEGRPIQDWTVTRAVVS